MKKIAFTLVLNGMPFIKRQAQIIPKHFDKWYIIEGATKPHHDTSWCTDIDSRFFNTDNLSVDGTTEFLDGIASDKISVIRKHDFWDGKREMCNSFMAEASDCILMEFDVDEIWQDNVLSDVLNYAEVNDNFDCMVFRCNYFVGPRTKIITKNGYADDWIMWRRLWKVRQHTHWIAHEPPILNGTERYLDKDFTENRGWVFDHFAYAIREQLEFKQNFYRYEGAVDGWSRLQAAPKPCRLGDYLKWVTDGTIVDNVRSGERDLHTEIEQFKSSD